MPPRGSFRNTGPARSPRRIGLPEIPERRPDGIHYDGRPPTRLTVRELLTSLRLSPSLEATSQMQRAPWCPRTLPPGRRAEASNSANPHELVVRRSAGVGGFVCSYPVPVAPSSISQMIGPLGELREIAVGITPAPAEMSDYLAKVRDRAFAVTDQDVETLKEAGIAEDAIFEQTVAVAIAEGLRRLDRASEVIG